VLPTPTAFVSIHHPFKYSGWGLTVERIRRVKTSLLKEIRRIPNQRIPANNLDQIHHDANLGPHEIRILETLKVGSGGFEFLLEKIGLFDADEGLFNVWSVFGGR
jgi:hypothetical protein